MENKDLRKLRREDLLQIMLDQSRQLEQQQEELTRLKKTAAERDRAGKAARSSVDEKEKLILSLNQQLQSCGERQRTLEAELKERQERLSKSESRLRTRTADLQDLQRAGEKRAQQERQEREKLAARAQERISALKKELDQARRQLEQKELLVQRLREEAEDRENRDVTGLDLIADELMAGNDRLFKQMKALRGGKEALEKTVSEQETQLRQLRAQLRQKESENRELWEKLMQLVKTEK